MMPLGAANVIAQISPIFSEKNGGRVPSVHFITEPLPSYKATNADLALAKIIQGLI
jgi:hypothetical protein